jgi:hypothetical protein
MWRRRAFPWGSALLRRGSQIDINRFPLDGKTSFFEGLDDFCRRCFPIVKGDDDNPLLRHLESADTVRISQDGPHPGPIPSGVTAGNV